MTKIQQSNKEKQLKILVVKLRDLTDNYKRKYDGIIKDLKIRINQLLNDLSYYVSVKRLRAIIAPVVMISGIFFADNLSAQSVPQGINYQAVARDANGGLLMNQALTIKFSVISDATTSS
tara:strand:+ start:227 stop:586 length:360 start_codon:yes stop_codon:yes gene_type:complete